MKFYLISDNVDTLLGMRLAGIEGEVVATPQEVETALKKAIADENIGIVLMTENLCRMCNDLVYEVKLNHPRPLLVEIPDRHGSRSKDSITRYVREAIGVKI